MIGGFMWYFILGGLVVVVLAVGGYRLYVGRTAAKATAQAALKNVEAGIKSEIDKKLS
jgi:hypothetical protein